MFDWIGQIVEAISNAIGGMVSFLGTQIANAIFDAILKWFYEMIYNAVANFFTEMGKMGAEMFDLSWVQATVTLFTYFLPFGVQNYDIFLKNTPRKTFF